MSAVPTNIFKLIISNALKLIMANGSHKRHIRVAVEGNIGSGKTSLLNYFKQFDNTEVHIEPVARWRDINGTNALALQYQDPQRWSMTLQSYVQLTMLQVHECAPVKSVKLMERSLYSARYCFIENLYKRGSMTHFEYSILCNWFDYILQTDNSEKCRVDLIVYLKTTPEILHDRIIRRCRPEETAIPLDYLKGLHELHEDWLVRGSQFAKPAPCLVIDADCSVDEMVAQYEGSKAAIFSGLIL